MQNPSPSPSPKKIGAVVIHAATYTARKKYVQALAIFFANTDVHFKVIDGVITDRVLYDARYKTTQMPLTKGQIGCALAHLKALETAIEMDLDYVFIFEDDVEIIAENYSVLKEWLDNLPPHDICLVTNVGSHQGLGHDGRLHTNTNIGADLIQPTCPFGTQAYYISKPIIKLLYTTQLQAMQENKIYIADGLTIHCEKNHQHTHQPIKYLNILTPQNPDKFFKHIEGESIRENLS